MDLREHAHKGQRLTYYNSEFVVALKHVERVVQVLDECGVSYEGPQRNSDLGLALIALSDDASAADLVNDLLHEERRTRNRAAQPPDRPPLPGLDGFLPALRELFALRSAGWCPTMGKNRLVGDVIGGVGKISHGGGDMPTQTDERFADRSALGETSRGTGVRVAVLDTSISAHEWLAGGWVSPPGEVLAASDQLPVAAGHATFVAGLVLEQAPACVVDARRLLSDDYGQATSWDAAVAIAEIGKTRPDVLNLSFACYTGDGQPPLALATAIDRLDSGTVVVAAAGNHGDLLIDDQNDWDQDDRRKPAWPAALDTVVAIGAATSSGAAASFTPSEAEWIDAMTHGENVVSTFVSGHVNLADDAAEEPDLQEFDGWAAWSGTSFSAARVSGLIAAKTVPGRTSARQAWEEILRNARRGLSVPPLIEP